MAVQPPNIKYMNKKNTITILIILAILISAVFSYFFIFKKAEVAPPFGGSTSQYQKQLSEIVKDKSFEKCDEIKDDFYKKVCVNNVAVELAKENLDLSYCAKVDGQLISENYCQEQVLLLKFEKEETGEFCKELQDASKQEDCLINFYNQLALKKDNADICQNIADTRQAELCHDNYIVSKIFTQNQGKIDCSLLKNSDAKLDCENIKPDILSGDPTLPPKMNEKCLLLKTRIFTPYCL